jgi:hypothetical protein
VQQTLRKTAQRSLNIQQRSSWCRKPSGTDLEFSAVSNVRCCRATRREQTAKVMSRPADKQTAIGHVIAYAVRAAGGAAPQHGCARLSAKMNGTFFPALRPSRNDSSN